MHAHRFPKTFFHRELQPNLHLTLVVGVACLWSSALSAQSRPRPSADAAEAIAFELAFLDAPGTPRERESVRLRVLATGEVHCFDGRELVP